MIPFYTITWDFNSKEVSYYDIMPYLLKCYEEEKIAETHYWGGKVRDSYPQTKEDIKEFILGRALHRWWSRCEYEVIIKQWPPHENCEEKIDIYDQIQENIEAVLNIFIQNIG